MSSRIEVLLWAQRAVARKHAPPHELLEIKEDATLEQAQEAFHKLAKMAHPDLHRTTLDATELENVTTAYAYIAAAYQAIRVARLRGVTGKVAPASSAPPPVAATPEKAPAPAGGDRAKRPSEMVRLPGGGISARAGGATRPAPAKPAGSATVAAPTAAPARGGPAGNPAGGDITATPGEGTPISPSAAMNGKALVYYRKAESALRQGDLRMAVLNLKMAIASDPASPFLRQALAEVDAELKAK